jgi:hypothetical protein
MRKRAEMEIGIADKTEHENFLDVLRDIKEKEENFKVEESPRFNKGSYLDPKPYTRIITVKYKPSNLERKYYVGGHKTNWTADFKEDWDKGLFETTDF